MRLRRLELAIIGVTLAFACFMGGFFTGRSWSAVNIVAVATQGEESYGVGISITQPEAPVQENTTTPATPAVDNAQTTPAAQETNQPAEVLITSRDGDGKININLASQSELMDLPGIGNVLASRIVDHRRQYGDFTRIEDIRDVSGIGEKRYEAIQDKITVG
jgi:competence protein ComEA